MTIISRYECSGAKLKQIFSLQIIKENLLNKNRSINKFATLSNSSSMIFSWFQLWYDFTYANITIITIEVLLLLYDSLTEIN